MADAITVDHGDPSWSYRDKLFERPPVLQAEVHSSPSQPFDQNNKVNEVGQLSSKPRNKEKQGLKLRLLIKVICSCHRGHVGWGADGGFCDWFHWLKLPLRLEQVEGMLYGYKNRGEDEIDWIGKPGSVLSMVSIPQASRSNEKRLYSISGRSSSSSSLTDIDSLLVLTLTSASSFESLKYVLNKHGDASSPCSSCFLLQCFCLYSTTNGSRLFACRLNI